MSTASSASGSHSGGRVLAAATAAQWSSPSTSRDSSQGMTNIGGDETCSVTSVMPAGYPSYCRLKRPCRSCLQKANCMINQYGKCVEQTTSTYSSWLDFRKAFELNLALPNATTTNPAALQSTQTWNFRSLDATYCPADDAVCQQCIASRFWIPSRSPDSRFCVGQNGCVCISICEDYLYVAGVDCSSSSTAPTPTPASTINVDMSTLNTTIQYVGFALGGLLILMALCLYHCVRRDYTRRVRQEEQRRQERDARAALRREQRQQRMEERGVSMLSLSGWQKYRQSLIDKETSRLAGGGSSELESQSTPYVLAMEDVAPEARAIPAQSAISSRTLNHQPQLGL